MNKNLLENDELPASEPMYSELLDEGDREDIDQEQGVQSSPKKKSSLFKNSVAGLLFVAAPMSSGQAQDTKLVANVDNNKPVPVDVAANDTKLASLSVNTVDHLKKIKEFVDPNELIDYCKKEVRNMNAEEKEIAKQQFNILNLTAMLSPMKKEDIAAWIQNLKMDAWEKEEPYRSKIREIYNSAESSVGVEGGPNIEKTVVAKGEDAPLNETKEEREKREKVLKSVKIANIVLANAESVSFNSGDTASTTLKITDGTRIFYVKSKERKPKVGTNIRSTANVTIKGLLPGTLIRYILLPSQVKEASNGTKIVEQKIKEINSVRIILLNSSDEPIDMSGNPDKAFCIKVEKGVPQDFTMPPNSVGFKEKIDLPLDLDIAKGGYPDIEYRAGLSSIEILPKTPQVDISR